MKTSTPAPPPAPSRALDAERLRRDFPALDQEVSGRPLAYLDNAATSQKPRRVLDALRSYYEHDNANVHRGLHELSRRATDAYEAARAVVARWIGASSAEEVVWTRGTTESINLVAASWGGGEPEAGRRDPRFRDGTPLEPRALAARGRTHGGEAPLPRARRPGAPEPGSPSGDPRQGSRPDHRARPRVERARDDQPDCGDLAARARGGGAASRGRSAGGGAPRGGRRRARGGLLCVFRDTRCVGRPGSGSSGPEGNSSRRCRRTRAGAR